MAAALVFCAVFAAGASAATTFLIRGGGDGHGIGMSQYGADGYALHGKHYRWILAHYYRGTKLGTASPRRTVRVLLSTSANAFTGASRAGGKRLDPGKTYTVAANADGSVRLLGAKGRKLVAASAPLRVSGPGPLTLAGVGSYRGVLEFRPAGGTIETVDAVGLDDYVRGVISAEMPATWDPEALKVQAVAARSYAITSDVGGSVFDLYPDTRSQMYGGVAAETATTDAAVAATAGQVVTFRGVPVLTYFFNSSGGHTENVENVWPGATPEPWLKGVRDSYDGAARDPYHRWGVDLSLAAAAGKLHPFLQGKLLGVRVTKHGSSPRVLRAQVVGTNGTTSVSGPQLQQAFGLLTTYATFTTISTLPGQARHGAPGRSRVPRGSVGSGAVVALVPLVNRLVARTVSGLHGDVFPAPRGARLTIQRSQHRRWRTVLHIRLAARGSYDTALPRTGTYRVVFRGLAGPAITVR